LQSRTNLSRYITFKNACLFGCDIQIGVHTLSYTHTHTHSCKVRQQQYQLNYVWDHLVTLMAMPLWPSNWFIV